MHLAEMLGFYIFVYVTMGFLKNMMGTYEEQQER